MIGAIAGDIIGSAYESAPIKTTEFKLFQAHSTFTDDTVLTVATASAILHNGQYVEAYRSYGRRYPHAGYGGSFLNWLSSHDSKPYSSWGNGSAMRVSPIGFAYDSVAAVLDEARLSAVSTHNHPEGIKGAQALALAVFLAHHGADKAKIKEELSNRFLYDLNRSLDSIRPFYSFDISCQGSVPESIIAFMESVDFEDAIRKAISLGGDSDTMACIAGAIAQAYYRELPAVIIDEVRKRLPMEFLETINRFNAACGL